MGIAESDENGGRQRDVAKNATTTEESLVKGTVQRKAASVLPVAPTIPIPIPNDPIQERHHASWKTRNSALEVSASPNAATPSGDRQKRRRKYCCVEGCDSHDMNSKLRRIPTIPNELPNNSSLQNQLIQRENIMVQHESCEGLVDPRRDKRDLRFCEKYASENVVVLGVTDVFILPDSGENVERYIQAKPSMTPVAVGRTQGGFYNVSFLPVKKSNHRLAYQYTEGGKKDSPAVLFCSGFQSSMSGNKAVALEEYCSTKGMTYCRFDYRGHGVSSGKTFEDCTLTDWIEDATHMLEHMCSMQNDKNNKVVLVGSSMGGWIALHLAMKYSDRIAGIVGIAAAPDFLEDLYAFATPEQQIEWKHQRTVHLPTKYGDVPYPISWKLIQDARDNWRLLQKQKIPVYCPVRLLHGQCDEDVSWKKSMELAEQLETEDTILTLIKSGDHRLSRPQDLERICSAVDELVVLAQTLESNSKYGPAIQQPR